MWYYMQDGAQQGPISEEELQSMARDGRLQPTDMVWKSGMQEWQQANQVSVLPFSAPAIPAAPGIPEIPSTPSASDHGSSSYGSSSAAAPSTPSYGAPATYGGAAGGAISDVQITNYLPWAIVVTLLCCLPGGIVSIVYATKSNSAKQVGNFAEAQEAAKQAKLWLTISVGVSLALTLLYVVIIIFSAVASNA